MGYLVIFGMGWLLAFVAWGLSRINKQMAWQIIGALSGVVIGMSIVAGGIAIVSQSRQHDYFTHQRMYIESHVAQNEAEWNAMELQRMRYNIWLQNAQDLQRLYPELSFYGDRVLRYTMLEGVETNQ